MWSFPLLSAGNVATHLLDHLWQEYRRDLADRVAARRSAGLATVDADEAARRAPAVDFVSWAARRLSARRVVAVFGVDDGNCAVVWDDGVTVSVRPRPDPSVAASGGVVPVLADPSQA